MLIDGMFVIPQTITVFFTKYGLLGLFLNGMVSSFIPIPTELTTAALLATGENELRIFIALVIGSILGGFIAYYLGYTGNDLSHRVRKMTKVESESTQRSYALLAKYGWLLIFISPWIPVGGDVISIIAGIKKYDLTKFTIAMIAGKVIKAVAIVYFLSIILIVFFH
ncbi:MAG TPA: VTT domain-containing protein [Candidatus Nitrosopolaris sp.]|nr:VTT domain-containing protein [Candidatus Nitrosopolaris sp.]